jgi:hypothetical protein
VTASVYVGTRHPDGRTSVSVNGQPLRLRADFRKESSTAFDWGYEGHGGPSQLALAILADHLADDVGARRLYQHFLRSVISGLPGAGWTLTAAQIDAALPDDGAY